MLTANAVAGIKTLVGNVGLVPLSTCPDEVRTHERNPSFVLSPECLAVFPSPQPTGTASWHFINLDVAKSDPKDAQMDAFCKNDCVVAKIVAFQQVLGNKAASTASRAQALSFLLHFVGDVHQPLHAAERGNDLGGNLLIVLIPSSIGSTEPAMEDNLHSAWDTFFVNMLGGNEIAVATKIAAQVADAKKEAVPPQIGAWVHDWARQSEDLARTVAYQDHHKPLVAKPTPTLSGDYERLAMETIEGQLARAGVRLAALINGAFK
jgi:hypothetical protein